MPLEAIIHQKIRENGAITVAEYMELALYHLEHGYYMSKNPFGAKGDFITAPDISQVFGELIGAWAADIWFQSGAEDLQIVEIGGGKGSLMSDFLRATANISSFHDALTITMVDSSPKLRSIQQKNLQKSHSRIYWREDLSDLARMPTIFIMNELFDALPIRQYIRTADGLKERMIELDDNGELAFVIQETGLRLIKGGEYSDDNLVVESCGAAKHIMQQICNHISEFGGTGLIIDYGYTGGSNGNSLQAVKTHGFHDVLKDAGEADITSHVDFDALIEVIAENNHRCFDVITQGKFLQRLGIELRAAHLMKTANEQQCEEIASSIDRLISPAKMGNLFKVLAFTSHNDLIPSGF